MRYLLCLTCLCLTTTTHAEVILDQSYSPAAPPHEAVINTQVNSVIWAQTFTVGVNGLLSELDLKIHKEGFPSEPLLVDIRTVSGGVPSFPDSGANILESWSISPALLGFGLLGADEFVRTALPNPIAVTTGDQLAIVLRSDQPASGLSPSYRWQGLTTGPGYSGGATYLKGSTAWGIHGSDRAFQTFVDVPVVPEPSSCALLAGLGIAWFGRARRRALNTTQASSADR